MKALYWFIKVKDYCSKTLFSLSQEIFGIDPLLANNVILLKGKYH